MLGCSSLNDSYGEFYNTNIYRLPFTVYSIPQGNRNRTLKLLGCFKMLTVLPYVSHLHNGLRTVYFYPVALMGCRAGRLIVSHTEQLKRKETKLRVQYIL